MFKPGVTLRLRGLPSQAWAVMAALVLVFVILTASYSVVAAYYRVIPEVPTVTNPLLPEGQIGMVAFSTVAEATTRVHVLSCVNVTGPSVIGPGRGGEALQTVFCDEWPGFGNQGRGEEWPGNGRGGGSGNGN